MVDDNEKSPRAWRVSLAAAMLGLAGIAFGVPQFMAGVHLGPQDDTLREIAAERVVPAAILRRTADGREAAFGWLEHGAILSDLAVLRLAAAAQAPVFSADRRRLASEGIAFQRRALTLAPADGFGWTRLLQGLAIAAAPVDTVKPILSTAIDRAANESSLVRRRLNVALLYWGGLDERSRDRMGPEIRRAALWSPDELARAARARLLEEEVARRLVGDPVALARYNAARAWMTAREQKNRNR